MHRLAAVVLAAGEGRRFGAAWKLTAQIAGEPIVRRVAGIVVASGISQIVAVTGRERKACEEALAALPLTFAHNDRWAEGMGGSVALGAAAASRLDVDGLFVVPGDMPLLSADIFRGLANAFQQSARQSIVFPVTPDGEQRNPVLWPRRFFADLAGLSGPKGAKGFLGMHASEALGWPVPDAAPFMDIDTPDDLARAATLISDPMAKCSPRP